MKQRTCALFLSVVVCTSSSLAACAQVEPDGARLPKPAITGQRPTMLRRWRILTASPRQRRAR